MFTAGNYIFLWFFSVLLVTLCIISIAKKRFLEFFFPAVLFLPDYYGFEIMPSVPLLSVKRIIYIILYIYLFFAYRKELLPCFKKVHITPEKICLLLYFVFRFVSNGYYIFTYSQAIKTILIIVFEQLLFIAAIILIPITSEKWTSIIKSIVYSSAVVFAMGIIESLSGYRPFDALYTVSRYVPNYHFMRAGLLRATVTMEMPTFMGNACVMVLPLIMYLYEKTKEKRYLLISFLCAVACVHSGTRSSLLFMIILIIIGAFLYIKNASRLIKYLLHVGAITLSIIVLFFILSLTSRQMKYYYVSFGKSVLNVVGFDFNLDEGSPSDSDGYGSNKDGSLSRTRQLTGIKYVAGINPIFGLGSGAQLRGDVKYLTKDKWVPSHTYDLGYVEAFCEEGVFGWLAYLSLFISFFIPFFSRRYTLKKDLFGRYILFGIVSYLLCMFSSANMQTFLFAFAAFVHGHLHNVKSNIA